MYKKSTAVLLVVSTIASSAFASSGFISKLTPKHNSVTQSLMKSQNKTRKTNLNYTDFSGEWIADCGEGESFYTVIQNNDHHISFDNHDYIIGKGLEGNHEANEFEISSENTSFEWNDDGSTLIMKGINYNKYNFMDDSAIETDLSTFTLMMNNGHINLDGKFTFLENVTTVEQSKPVHCVLAKKAITKS